MAYTLGRNPLNEITTHRRGFCLHNPKPAKETSMPAEVFEPTLSANERPNTYVLESAATGICFVKFINFTKHIPLIYIYIMECDHKNSLQFMSSVCECVCVYIYTTICTYI
jgi:hypothetical protein